jgi:hypothetical protein
VLPLLPVWLYILNLLMFALVNLAHSQTLAAVIGMLMLGYLAAQRSVLRHGPATT